MGHEAHRAVVERGAEDARLAQLVDEGDGAFAVARAGDDDVGLDRRRIAREPAAGGQALREAARVSVVARKPLDMVSQRVQRARGDDARLAHAAAEELAVAARAL